MKSLVVLVGLSLGLLAAFDVGLIALLALSHEIPQNAHLVVVVLVEIEAIPMAKADLEKVVI